MREHRYAVYIMASRSHTFYVGVTNNIEQRVSQRKEHEQEGFPTRYHINRIGLVSDFRGRSRCHRARTTAEAVAKTEEDSVDRIKEPNLAGPVG